MPLASPWARRDRLLPSLFFPVMLFFELRLTLPESSLAVAPVRAVEVDDVCGFVCDEEREGTVSRDRFFFGLSGTLRLEASAFCSIGSLWSFKVPRFEGVRVGRVGGIPEDEGAENAVSAATISQSGW